MKLPTYPARPINGGPFPKAREKCGQWIYEPKYNGWRALVHIDTGFMFNRQGEPFSISSEFHEALRLLRSTLDAAAFEWADIEALHRRHTIGRGCLIVLDVVPEPDCARTVYVTRRAWIQEPVLPVLDRFMPPWSDHYGVVRAAHGFPLISVPPILAPAAAWAELQEANRRLGVEGAPCAFYEGLVAKRTDSVYPIQLRCPEEPFPFWVKHRWQF